ncbi:energy transducer TonB [Mangrovivirga cuniculi]|uniref:TonB C-terminal domain-containing protein n=1 Tax=Mangrovivirga cuniculi TaxID=2715131 RepID=A0A4D7JGZ3_9BACT|nr:energy transducer TonB [Mangrovivirga cuniculi]QCK14343.1 hypothetical protein DCC35_06095 [Mangrovivirga cuniculi]
MNTNLQHIKNIALISLLITISCKQTEVEPMKEDKSIIEIDQNDYNSCIFKCPLEESATFPGGIEHIATFIKENINLSILNRKYFEGRVFVRFTISETGQISNIKVVKGIEDIVDQEAIRIVKLFPDFEPGKLQGIPVKQQIIIPVYFNI